MRADSWAIWGGERERSAVVAALRAVAFLVVVLPLLSLPPLVVDAVVDVDMQEMRARGEWA